MADTLAGAIERVRNRVAASAERSGRDPASVSIVGAMKDEDMAAAGEAVAAGLTDLGVNRAQNLKAADLPTSVRWHYLGGIQSNKVRYLDRVHLVHSLDRLKEAEALHHQGERLDRTWDVLIEVNIAGEQSKQGIAPAGVEQLLEGLALYPRVQARGFMFVAPQAQNPEDVRWVFAEGKRLRDRFEAFGLIELSMGMTDDYQVAVEEGATIVRIGRAIFRPEKTYPGPKGN